MHYIELNPVRAGMAVDPAQYCWSSNRANGLCQADARLTPHPLYPAIDAQPAARRQAYRASFRPQLDEDAAADIREALRQGIPLGSQRRVEAICARVGIRRNSGKPGRSPGEQGARRAPLDQKQGFGF